MPKKISGKVLHSRLNGVKLVTALELKRCVKDLSTKVTVRSSIMLGFIVEEVWIMYQQKLLVDTQIESDNHLDIKS